MSLECLWILCQEGVDQSEKLHNTLILSEILMTLQQESMIFAIAALDTQFSRSVTSEELVTKQGDGRAGTSPLL